MAFLILASFQQTRAFIFNWRNKVFFGYAKNVSTKIYKGLSPPLDCLRDFYAFPIEWRKREKGVRMRKFERDVFRGRMRRDRN